MSIYLKSLCLMEFLLKCNSQGAEICPGWKKFEKLISAEEGRLLGTKEYTHIFTCRFGKIHKFS